MNAPNLKFDSTETLTSPSSLSGPPYDVNTVNWGESCDLGKRQRIAVSKSPKFAKL